MGVVFKNMADNVYGPVIPPHFLPRKREGSIDEKESEITSKPKRLCTDDDNDGDKHLMPSAYGPMIPEHLLGREDNEDISNEDNDDDDDVSFGPKLPPDMIQSNSVTSPTVDNDDDDEVIGPMLPSDGSTSTDNFPHLAHEIDSRSRQMKDKLTNKGSGLVKPSREEWMMELPPEIQVHALGLGPRKFKTKYTEVGDRSVWTRMPGEMPPKDNEKKTSSEEESVSSVRDQKLAEEVEEYNKSYRSESLMEIHKKKRAEKGEGQTNERRPFDRDIDLAMPQKIITSSKRTSLIKDSQKSLSSKFARGKTSFL